ncbi:hypothetical protein LB506_006124 [Fusarium annulatum]|nr:hypothetical protein LB506_006124 [Fusarium annulatum]
MRPIMRKQTTNGRWIALEKRNKLREEYAQVTQPSDYKLGKNSHYAKNDLNQDSTVSFAMPQKTFLTGQNDRDYSALLPWHPLNDISRYVM